MRKDTVMTSYYCRSLFSLVWPLPLPQLSPLPMLATAMLATLLAMLLPPMLMVSLALNLSSISIAVNVKCDLCSGYTASLAAQPVAYAAAPVAGVYAGVDPSVAYANLCKFAFLKIFFIDSGAFNRPRC